jgi:predicted nucleic acid-binding protein
MRVLIDTNIILDVLLEREPFVEDAIDLFTWIEQGQLEAHIAATTITNIFYILRKAESREFALEAIARILQGFNLCPITHNTIELALQQSLKDFEDGVQTACALESNLDAIITRNQRDFSNLSVPAWSIAELRAKIC